ncbi:MAG: SAM-dependent methyltransferase [Saprospiraceae bacterium]|nr:SAM-dependent methyltransferase [Saprospiraceae bacterium]MBK9720495.1 SAM-dependent methyltransferase [Saprospiraceae bacterium]
MNKGILHLIPVPLSGGNSTSLCDASIQAARSLNIFVAERAKTARQFLKEIKHPIPLNELTIYEYPQKEVPEFEKGIIDLILSGSNMGLVSEAGLPCIADPGFELVQLAHQHQVQIVPYAGPNSMIMALMASGFSGQEFHFHGYLPAKKEILRSKLIQLSQELKRYGIPQIFMETPYRNKQVLELVKHNVPADLKLSISCSLTTDVQSIKTKRVRDWNMADFTIYFDQPAIFILGK